MKFTNSLSRKRQNGIAMTEFAVVLPFLMLVIAATGDIGYLMQQQNTLIKSIETGGRYISVNANTGAGFTVITAQKVQNTRNVVLFGNASGIGDPIIPDLDPLNIDVSCTYGTRNGHCLQDKGLTQITVQANYTYSPILGEVFDNVTGFNFFPLPLSAITIVESI
jgi:Flp pilus assembly protein TadG